MERCPTQAVLPLVGLAADKVIRDRYITRPPTPSRRSNLGRMAGFLTELLGGTPKGAEDGRRMA
ncbi:MAG: hypothetical protein R6U98_18445 [Pirellulaceae bacterium]